MVNHRDQAKFDRAAWRLKVLLPSWVVQISLLIILITTSAYLFSKAINQSVEVRGTAIAWECMNLAVSIIALLLTAYEITMMVLEGLTPKMMLVTNLVKLVGGVLCMIMDGMVTGTSLNGWADGTLVIHSLFMISILVSGSYAGWKLRRLAEYDEYHHPINVKPFGFNSDLKHAHHPTGSTSSHARVLSDDLDWDPELEMGNTVEITSTPASPGTPGATASRTRGSSFTRLAGRMNFSLTGDADAVNDEAAARRARASSAASLMAQDTSYDPAATLPRRPASYVSVTGSGSDRRASYNHTRDSAFDEYVLRQKEDRRDRSGSSASRVSSSSGREGSDGSSSPPATTTTSTTTTTSRARAESAAAYRLSLNLKNDVDDALSAEFGWGSVSRSSSQDSVMAGGQPAAIAVGGGVVTSAKSVRDSLGRAPSDGSERGALGSVNESGDDEEEEEEDQDEGHSSGDDWRRRNVDEASRALLGEGSREDGRAHPELLRPGRPKSEIEFVITPPPKSPSPGPNVRSTWGNAYAS